MMQHKKYGKYTTTFTAFVILEQKNIFKVKLK